MLSLRLGTLPPFPLISEIIMKVFFSNPPWYAQPENGKPGWRGVRAGSRWPHTFEVHSHTVENGLIKELVGGYMPFPLWLSTAAAFARREGFDTLLRDSIAMGETYENFYQYVEASAPDLVVIETSTPTLRNDLQIVRTIRKMLPSVRVIFTGLHFELETEEFLGKYPEIDMTVYGEYEDHLTQLLVCLRDGGNLKDVPGIVYRADGKARKSVAAEPTETPASKLPAGSSVINIQRNDFNKLAELETFPWAWRDPLPNENYYDSVCGLERPQLQLMSTRGCPYGCIFCAWPQMLFRGPRYRKRTAQDVVDEIQANLEKVPYKSIYIDDDTFNISKQFVMELAAKMKESGIGGRIPWSTMGRADLMDEQTLKALADAGLFSIKYGVESAEQDIIDEIDKRQNLEKAIRMIKLTKELGIRVHLTFTFGLPGDTVETIEKTIDLACTLPVDTVQFSISTPFPGTEMYRLYKEKGWLVSEDWDDYNGSTVAVSRTDNFTAEQLEYYVAEAYRRFDQAQVKRQFESSHAAQAIAKIAETHRPGDSVVVLQSSRVTLTRWIVNALQQAGLDVHLATPLRFKNEFTSIMPEEKIHAFDGNSHFNYELHRGWASRLKEKFGFSGALIPYTHESRDGYRDVERLATEMGSQILLGITQRGSLYHWSGQQQ